MSDKTVKLGAFVFMFAAIISAVSHGFSPSRWTELFLWISINFFVLDKVTRRIK
tara:strand:- start:216 stop:377 length:162 start_codon:yes stop_codon:yes gene_type:complete